MIGASLEALVGARGWLAVAQGELLDPDSYMRLERVLDGIAAGHLVNMVARDQSGAGVLVEWSRLLDGVLWLLAAPLAPLLGWRQALFAAGVALGPLGVGTLSAALAFAAAPLAPRRFLLAVPLAAATLPPLQNYGQPGVVTHHILLIAAIALAVGWVVRAWRGDTRAGLAAGLSGGLALWLTPETLPYVLAAYGALALHALEFPLSRAIASTGSGFFAATATALALDPPQAGWFAPEPDRLSITFLALAGAVLCASLAFLAARAALALGATALFLALWLAAFPVFLHGTAGLAGPAAAHAFFDSIGEMRPPAGLALAVAYLLPGALALGYAGAEALRGRNWVFAYLTATLAAALALAAAHARFAPATAATAAGLLPVALARLSARPAARFTRVAALTALLLLPRLPSLAASAPPATPASRQATLPQAAAPSCDLRAASPWLAKAAGAIVLADVNLTPELLWRDPVLTVGSLYHHGMAGFLLLRDAWRAAPGTSEPQAVAATGARFILFCDGAGRSLLVADLPPTTLWDALSARLPPPWLIKIAADPRSGFRLYAIAPKRD